MREQTDREDERRRQEVEREEKRLQDRKDRVEERRREDIIREERRIEREERDKQAAAEREVQLLATLKAAQPTVPQTVHLDSTKLPVMGKGEDIELFLELFESALLAGGVPEDKWVPKLHSAIDTDTKLTMKETITTPGVTYDEIKRALVGQTHFTFAAASESLVTLDNGAITKLPIRQAVQKMARLFEKVTDEATTMHEMCLYSAVAVLRVALARDCKQYIDVKGSCESNSFCCSLEEWQRTNPGRPIWESKQRHFTDRPIFSQRQPYRPLGQTKRAGECYHCGKLGHFVADCRSGLAGDRPAPPRRDGPPPGHQPTTATEVPKPTKQFQRPLADTTCFSCHKKGHISPNCPTRKNKVKKVRVEEDKIEILKPNEVFGAVGPHRMPVTLDTGAEVTVVPEEAVERSQFTGGTCELRSFNDTKSVGRKCVVQVSVGKQTFTREAVTQPGKSLGWSVCLSLNLADSKERDFLMEQTAARANMPERHTLYIPPEVRTGFLVSGLPITEVMVVKAVKPVEKVQHEGEVAQQEPIQSVASEAQQGEQTNCMVDFGNEKEVRIDEADENEVDGEILETEQSLVIAEEEGESSGGSAETEGLTVLPVTSIREGMPTDKMVAETVTDPSLAYIKKLATLDKEGTTYPMGEYFAHVLTPLVTHRSNYVFPKASGSNA